MVTDYTEWYTEQCSYICMQSKTEKSCCLVKQKFRHLLLSVRQLHPRNCKRECIKAAWKEWWDPSERMPSVDVSKRKLVVFVYLWIKISLLRKLWMTATHEHMLRKSTWSHEAISYSLPLIFRAHIIRYKIKATNLSQKSRIPWFYESSMTSWKAQ